ncbi:MAG: hypothetical protein QG604_600 [Candidatus Dependentiae bacterium]|nr:hypothetical protein [Candidatus Dependentiae bacterium]
MYQLILYVLCSCIFIPNNTLLAADSEFDVEETTSDYDLENIKLLPFSIGHFKQEIPLETQNKKVIISSYKESSAVNATPCIHTYIYPDQINEDDAKAHSRNRCRSGRADGASHNWIEPNKRIEHTFYSYWVPIRITATLTVFLPPEYSSSIRPELKTVRSSFLGTWCTTPPRKPESVQTLLRHITIPEHLLEEGIYAIICYALFERSIYIPYSKDLFQPDLILMPALSAELCAVLFTNIIPKAELETLYADQVENMAYLIYQHAERNIINLRLASTLLSHIEGAHSLDTAAIGFKDIRKKDVIKTFEKIKILIGEAFNEADTKIIPGLSPSVEIYSAALSMHPGIKEILETHAKRDHLLYELYILTRNTILCKSQACSIDRALAILDFLAKTKTSEERITLWLQKRANDLCARIQGCGASVPTPAGTSTDDSRERDSHSTLEVLDIDEGMQFSLASLDDGTIRRRSAHHLSRHGKFSPMMHNNPLLPRP